MKRIKQLSVLTALLIIGISVQAVTAGISDRKAVQNPQNFITIKGKVVDKETGLPLVFAGITVKENNVATITNLDGEFSIKLPTPLTAKNLEVSFVGYKNETIPISSLKADGGNNTILLVAAIIPIQEIVIKPMYPEEIIEEAIYNISKNYPSIPNLMTSFYRETIKKNRTYVSIGEAVVEIFKAPYANDIRYDGSRIYKGRKNNDVNKMDTVLFKLQGGPVTSLQLDLVKNPESALTKESMDQYDYVLTNIVEIDNKRNYVIEFKQKKSVETPMFLGRFYIDVESYAVSEIEFGYDLSNEAEASTMFIRKKPLGMNVIPTAANYLVKYREQDGKWYFAYSRAEVRFKVDWKKKLFNTNYTTMSEIAITDRTEEEVIKFANKEKLKYADIFSDEVSAFADPEYWGDYNVIEPDQSIEAAIRRLARSLKFSDREPEDVE
jgi:hypothetical protein